MYLKSRYIHLKYMDIDLISPVKSWYNVHFCSFFTVEIIHLFQLSEGRWHFSNLLVPQRFLARLSKNHTLILSKLP